MYLFDDIDIILLVQINAPFYLDIFYDEGEDPETPFIEVEKNSFEALKDACNLNISNEYNIIRHGYNKGYLTDVSFNYDVHLRGFNLNNFDSLWTVINNASKAISFPVHVELVLDSILNCSFINDQLIIDYFSITVEKIQFSQLIKTKYEFEIVSTLIILADYVSFKKENPSHKICYNNGFSVSFDIHYPFQLKPAI